MTSRGFSYYRSLVRKHDRGLLEDLEIEDSLLLRELFEDTAKTSSNEITAGEMLIRDIKEEDDLVYFYGHEGEGLRTRPIVRRLFEAGYIEKTD